MLSRALTYLVTSKIASKRTFSSLGSLKGLKLNLKKITKN